MTRKPMFLKQKILVKFLIRAYWAKNVTVFII